MGEMRTPWGRQTKIPNNKTRRFSSNRRRLCALLPAPMRTYCRFCRARNSKGVFADFPRSHRRVKHTLSEVRGLAQPVEILGFLSRSGVPDWFRAFA